ncbi:hypothetical protein [Actinomadura sediminis]|uniref:Uncharacterized protein n=1 Tax=Actinomadura sediminis TaxID=1038904 RepID=A0ABW3EY05_9ACTN
MADYRIHFVDGRHEELSADRCRYSGSRYVFERESNSGWRTVHVVIAADIVQLQDGVTADADVVRGTRGDGHRTGAGGPTTSRARW